MKKTLILLVTLLGITSSAFAYQVFRWSDADGNSHVMRCYPNGQCTAE